MIFLMVKTRSQTKSKIENFKAKSKIEKSKAKIKSKNIKISEVLEENSGNFNKFYEYTGEDHKLFCEETVNRIKKFGEKDPNRIDLYESLRRRCYGFDKNNKNKWLFDYLTKVIKKLNDKHWGFDIKELEYIGYVKYYGSDEGQIGWHMDVGRSSRSDFTKNKISCVVQLSDPKDYKGGELQIFGHDGINKIPKGKGYGVVFPSYFMHRVTPVTKGLREVITAIFTGEESFK
jgi:hypothetical protein